VRLLRILNEESLFSLATLFLTELLNWYYFELIFAQLSSRSLFFVGVILDKLSSKSNDRNICVFAFLLF